MLIKEMSMQSGYSSSALHERIYSSENMCGILIYTGAADKEGSLGAVSYTHLDVYKRQEQP